MTPVKGVQPEELEAVWPRVAGLIAAALRQRATAEIAIAVANAFILQLLSRLLTTRMQPLRSPCPRVMKDSLGGVYCQWKMRTLSHAPFNCQRK